MKNGEYLVDISAETNLFLAFMIFQNKMIHRHKWRRDMRGEPKSLTDYGKRQVSEKGLQGEVCEQRG